MMIHFRRLPSGMVLIALFLFSGCGTGNQADQTPEALYQQASQYRRSHDYSKALDCYNHAIALDTLEVNASRMVKALYEKRDIEGLTGDYYAAFKTAKRLEQLPAASLPDSLRNQLFVDKATWHRELGNFKAAATSLERLASPSQSIIFDKAALYQHSGDHAKAAAIYSRYIITEYDPATRMTALAGLLRCAVAEPELSLKTTDAIAAKIAAESKNVLRSDGDVVQRIQAIRAAAKSLQLLEKQRRNASYLLFRAQMLAEEAHQPLLIQVLRLEANAAIVRKADPCREAADYFRVHSMPYAQAVSLLMLGESKSLDAEERIMALQQGFALSRDVVPPYPAQEYLQLEQRAGRRLSGLLMEKSRIFELFDAQEKIGALALKRALLQYPNSFVLGKGHRALEAKVQRLLHETAGLLQRKAAILEQADGVAKSRDIDRALHIKRGKMLELIAEVRAVNPVAAEALLLVPVTLRTVQGALREDQMMLKPLLSDSLCGVLLIGKRQLQIAQSPLSFDAVHTPDSTFRALRHDLIAPALPFPETVSEKMWLQQAFRQPIAGAISSMRQLIVLAEEPLLYHTFGDMPLPAVMQRTSFLPSLKEFVLLSERQQLVSGSSQIFFYRADNLAGARLHKLFTPHDRIFLIRKNFSAGELEWLSQKISREMQNTASGSEALLALRQRGDTDKELWRFVTSYGVD